MALDAMTLAYINSRIGQTNGGKACATPDWNAADGEPGYIKSRTHYSESQTVVLLAETTVDFDSGGEGVVTDTAALRMDATYTVAWNGAVFICTPFSFQGFTAIGNTLFAGGGDSGHPFTIISMEGALAVCSMDATISSATVEIIEDSERVIPLPEKYLPESVRPVVVHLTEEEWDSGKIAQSFEGVAPALWSGRQVWLSYTQAAGATARMLVATFGWIGSGFILSGIVNGAAKDFEATTGNWAPPT